MKIYVRDARSKKNELVAGNRDELVEYLAAHRDLIYMRMVLRWFDEGHAGPLLIKNGQKMDVWTVEEPEETE